MSGKPKYIIDWSRPVYCAGGCGRRLRPPQSKAADWPPGHIRAVSSRGLCRQCSAEANKTRSAADGDLRVMLRGTPFTADWSGPVRCEVCRRFMSEHETFEGERHHVQMGLCQECEQDPDARKRVGDEIPEKETRRHRRDVIAYLSTTR